MAKKKITRTMDGRRRGGCSDENNGGRFQASSYRGRDEKNATKKDKKAGRKEATAAAQGKSAPRPKMPNLSPRQEAQGHGVQ